MMTSSDDRSLVRASQAGNAEAFGQLVSRHQARLYPTLLRLTGSPDDALDLMQDAFLRAYQKLDSFRGGSSFYTWVYRIAVNLALSHRRHEKADPTARLAVHPDAPGEILDAADGDPASALLQAERDALVQRALLELSDDARAVVVMRDMDGLSYEQIAETLEVPVGTVRSRLHRARSDLRDRLLRLEAATTPDLEHAGRPG
jgi:RNA polymerase sigma-70 factor (ECF subfamily)